MNPESPKSRILNEVGNHGAYSRRILQQHGAYTAIALGFILDKYDYLKRSGKLNSDWFYCKWDAIKNETGMTRNTFKKHSRKLELLGIIEIRKGSQDTWRYYKINEGEYIKEATPVKKDHRQNMPAPVIKLDQPDGQKRSASVIKSDQPGGQKRPAIYNNTEETKQKRNTEKLNTEENKIWETPPWSADADLRLPSPLGDSFPNEKTPSNQDNIVFKTVENGRSENGSQQPSGGPCPEREANNCPSAGSAQIIQFPLPGNRNSNNLSSAQANDRPGWVHSNPGHIGKDQWVSNATEEQIKYLIQEAIERSD